MINGGASNETAEKAYRVDEEMDGQNCVAGKMMRRVIRSNIAQRLSKVAVI
jgi:hypothetical protein